MKTYPIFLDDKSLLKNYVSSSKMYLSIQRKGDQKPKNILSIECKKIIWKFPWYLKEQRIAKRVFKDEQVKNYIKLQ